MSETFYASHNIILSDNEGCDCKVYKSSTPFMNFLD